MANELLVQLGLGAILSFAHYLGETASENLEKYHSMLISLSSGVFITVLFVDLLPVASKDNLNFSLMLLGFVAFHAIEKFVYQRHPKQWKERKELSVAGFFFSNFLNGVAIVLMFQFDAQLAFLITIPLAFAELAQSTLLSHLIERMKERNTYKIVLSASVFMGAIVGSILHLNGILTNNVFSFIIGTMFYIVIRDMLPRHKEGRLDMFLLGVVSMYLILMIFR
ncbi:hypothetical protein HY989_02505 [Candidatus Micrarchaeota archaeon]|nr:hypothetical protein [Candidatus Micrarchaeota archaeon]